MAEITVNSLGWGVQSFGLAAMSALGKLPPVDYALHADTSWERSETYAFAKKWTPWLEKRGVEVVTVSDLEQSTKMLTGEPDAPLFTLVDRWGGLSVPAYTSWSNGNPSGMLRRQCTQRWKIAPMRRWLSAELKRRGLEKSPGIVEQWIGFTLDEAHRVTPNDVKYITKVYPFLEMLDRPYTRQMVIHWLRENDLEVPVKSACVFCPFRRWQTWRQIQLSGNGDWERAIEVDRAIRHKRPGYLCYICDDRKPLEEHDFTRQMALW